MEQLPEESVLKRRALKETRAVADQLREIDTDIDVSYDEFKRRCLPLLLNRSGQFDTQAWIRLTSHPNVGIRVRDGDGKQIYYVPSLLSDVQMKNRNQFNIGVIAENFRSMLVEDPYNAPDVIERVLHSCNADRGEVIISAIDAIGHLNKIYKDHQSPIIVISTSLAATYTELTGKEYEWETAEVNPENPTEQAKTETQPNVDTCFDDSDYDEI